MCEFERKDKVIWLLRRIGSEALMKLACMTDEEVSAWFHEEYDRLEQDVSAAASRKLSDELMEMARELML